MQTVGNEQTEKNLNGRLKEKIVVITGGTSGIGKAIAKRFAIEGATVLLIGTNEEKGQRAIEEINSETTKDSASFFACDVSNFSTVQDTFTELFKKFGRIDVLVNNAGITRDQLLMKMTEEDWDRVLDVNAKSCFNCCKAIVRPMMKQRKGKIINTTSVIGLTGNIGQFNYAASKAALIGMTKSLAKELAQRSIQVNAIAPGYVNTEMTDKLPENLKEEIMKRIPLGRIGNPDDIAQAALFLASDMSDYITGQCIVVDGGMTI